MSTNTHTNKLGIQLTASSEKVVEHFDQALLEYVGWFGDPLASIAKAVEIDPTFTMGHCALAVMDVIGGATKKYASVSNAIALLDTKCPLEQISATEKLHVTALKAWADGKIEKACECWEQILLENPTDLFALKLAHDTYFYLGSSARIRDSIARVVPAWEKLKKEHENLYAYVCGMWSFGLEEMGDYDKAEKLARYALSVNTNDAWAVHAVAHVLEMRGDFKSGIEFLLSTMEQWNQCPALRIHIWWHLCLFMLDNGANASEILKIFDEEIRRGNSGVALDLVDASSLLWRLQLTGEQVGVERWKEVAEKWILRLNDHILFFNDLHVVMTLLNAGDEENLTKFYQSFNENIGAYKQVFPETEQNTQQEIAFKVGKHLLQAFTNVHQKKYKEAADLIQSVRYRIITIGGSHAQRDIFTLTLVHAALASGNNKLANSIINEREALKTNSGLLKRVIAASKN